MQGGWEEDEEREERGKEKNEMNGSGVVRRPDSAKVGRE